MSARSLQFLRYAITALFLWFGTQQIVDPGAWTGFLPEFTGYFPIPGEMLVQLNGWSEVVCAVLLALGLFVRPIAAFLALHLAGIAVTVGGAIGVRDAALAASTIVLVMNPSDPWTLDAKYATTKKLDAS